MPGMRAILQRNWIFYLLVLSYAYAIANMTGRLWFGEGINVFAAYSDASTAAEMVIDYNKVYWSKTCFLFTTLLLLALNFDIRAATGIAAIFWAGSLLAIFGATSPNVIFVLVLGVLLVVQQMWRRQVFGNLLAP